MTTPGPAPANPGPSTSKLLNYLLGGLSAISVLSIMGYGVGFATLNGFYRALGLGSAGGQQLSGEDFGPLSVGGALAFVCIAAAAVLVAKVAGLWRSTKFASILRALTTALLSVVLLSGSYLADQHFVHADLRSWVSTNPRDCAGRCRTRGGRLVVLAVARHEDPDHNQDRAGGDGAGGSDSNHAERPSQ